MTAPRVAVVLLNWNNYPDTKACLDGLTSVTYPDLTVVVVDNGSEDKSGPRLAAEYPRHTHVANATNLGFARGCNVGIRRALADPAVRYVLLLNNDAVPRSGFVEPLVAVAEADPDVGGVSGKVTTDDNRIWYAGGHVRVWRAGVWSRGMGEVDAGQYDAPGPTRWVSGGLVLLPRRVVEAVGLLPEEYFFGFEEYDYSETLLRAGFRLWYEPRSVVYHRVGGSHGNWEPKYLYNNYRNKLIMARRLLPRWAVPAWTRAFVAYTKWYSDRWRRKWAAEYSYGNHVVPDRDRFDFALREAMADERGGVPLDQDALAAYDRRWRQRTGGT